MDDGTFGSVLSSFGFKVETGVGINERFAPLWLHVTCSLILDSGFDQWLIWWFYSPFVVTSEIFSEKLQCWIVLFDLLLCQYQAAHFSFRVLKPFRFGAFQFIFSAKFGLRIPTEDLTLILLFWFKVELTLRLMKVVLGFGLSGHAAWDCLLGWFRDGSDGAILLLWLLPGVGYVERLEPIVVWWYWFGRSLLPGKPSNSPRCPEGTTMARRVPFSLSRMPASIEHTQLALIPKGKKQGFWSGDR